MELLRDVSLSRTSAISTQPVIDRLRFSCRSLQTSPLVLAQAELLFATRQLLDAFLGQTRPSQQSLTALFAAEAALDELSPAVITARTRMLSCCAELRGTSGALDVLRLADRAELDAIREHKLVVLSSTSLPADIVALLLEFLF